MEPDRVAVGLVSDGSKVREEQVNLLVVTLDDLRRCKTTLRFRPSLRGLRWRGIGVRITTHLLLAMV